MNGICSVYFCVNYRANDVRRKCRRMNNGVFNVMADEEYY
ncbi:hypothetical protein T4C_8047 [Trichinella pseudospiralis]|uniref:Uncharacterized protein n=1 Tax=Trichinella pseudospiralis TaxID=6337 RepID=A0A0V1GR16_TRIPS|nr:hypothetical protein T4C_8047 [Trichinella pseudospiralis]